MPIPPFTDQYIKTCEDGLGACAEWRGLIEKAKRCGQECAQQEELQQTIERMLQNYQSEFELSRKPRPLD